MTVKELKKISRKETVIELANPIHYYTGRVQNIPAKLLDLNIVYLTCGVCRYTKFNKNYDDGTMLLVDAK